MSGYFNCPAPELGEWLCQGPAAKQVSDDILFSKNYTGVEIRQADDGEAVSDSSDNAKV
jgi:hypothetical protein